MTKSFLREAHNFLTDNSVVELRSYNQKIVWRQNGNLCMFYFPDWLGISNTTKRHINVVRQLLWDYDIQKNISFTYPFVKFGHTYQCGWSKPQRYFYALEFGDDNHQVIVPRKTYRAAIRWFSDRYASDLNNITNLLGWLSDWDLHRRHDNWIFIPLLRKTNTWE